MKKKEYVSTGGVYDDGYTGSPWPTTTDMTKNESFEKNGYILVPNLIENLDDIYCSPLLDNDNKYLTGHLYYQRKDRAIYTPVERQVRGSMVRYKYPGYKELHYVVRKKIEKILGIDLLPSYYYERFYFVGQRLYRHSDRQACEVSATLQVSTNSSKPWPIWFEKPDGTEACAVMNDGDAVIYKGCEREHWRDPLESRYGKLQNMWRTFRKKEDDTYHHQIFLHYVNAQGPFLEHANDGQQSF